MPVIDPDTGFPVLKPVLITETVEVPKFRGGWRMVMKVGSLVLFDDEITTPNGELPVHAVRAYKIPREFWGMGVVEQTRHLNFLLDKSLKYAIENANRTANNRVIIDKSQVTNPDEVYKNERGGVITLEAGGDIDRAVKALPAMQLPTAHVSMINLLRELTDNVTGITDMRLAENLPKDASGKFLQEAESGANSRLSEIRENLIEDGLKPMVHNILAYSIAFEDRSRFIKITQSFGQKPAYVEFNPVFLSFQDEDFEARFDVEIGGNDLALNSVFEEDQLALQRVQSLAGLGPDLAFEMLKVLHVPNRKAIEKALNRFFIVQAQQAQQQTDPAQSKIEADQNEALSQIVRRVGESTADSIENLAKELGDTNPQAADQLISQMPDIVSENVARTIQQLSGSLGGQELSPEEQALLAQQSQQGLLPQ